MLTRRICGMLLGLVLVAGPAFAGNIIWVDEGAGGFAEWQVVLEGAGHTVTNMTGMNNLDQAKIDAMNASDLVIVSRDTNSGGYDDGDEITQWNSLTVPLIQTSVYLIRSSRWQWVDGTGTPTVNTPDSLVIVQDHQIFKGIGSAGDEVAILTAETNITDVSEAGNGQVLATHTDGRLWITLWEPEVQFYDGTTQVPAAPRMWFCAVGNEASGLKGGMNLNDVGVKLFLQAIGFMLGEVGGIASEPAPPIEAVDVPRDVILSWLPSEDAAAHDVYLGTSFEDVNDAGRDNPLGVLVSEGQADAFYQLPTPLEFGQTYYWRVDEVNAPPDSTIFRGEVWTFTAEPFAYPIEGVIATSNAASDPGVGPERTVDGSGLNENDEHSVESEDMWLGQAGADPVYIQYEFDRLYKLHQLLVWNYNITFEPVLGFGLKGVTVEYSTDGAEWVTLGDVEFVQATATPDYAANTAVDFAGAAARFVRLTVNSNHGVLPQYGLSEVRFLQIAASAREPQPADGAVDVDPDTVLSWRVGRGAAAHDVYFAAGQDELTLVDTVTENTYDPGPLDFGTAYAWRIDEVNEAVAEVWEGDEWTFATLEFAVIDDMETYDDEDNRIYDTWLDGFVNGTGSTVGYFEAPFAETTIVNSGRQSMPLEYANDAAPFYSEAERDLGSQDWTANGADTLRLFFRGNPVAFLERADGSIVIGAAGADIWGTADECRFVYKQLDGDGEIVARVDGIDNIVNNWAKAGVMIREATEPGARNTFMAMTGGSGGGATFQNRSANNVDSASQHTLPGNPFAPPYYVKLTRVGNTFSGFISPDGQTWQQAGNPVEVTMGGSVLIGLAATSHESGSSVSVNYSEVTTTGNVTGGWTIATIGVEMPSNDPDQLYVVVEDTSGNSQTVVHPDTAAVGAAGWQEWLIPYSDLVGVNLSRVAIIYIGVGDRDNPTAAGTGLLFVDDIGYGHPAASE